MTPVAIAVLSLSMSTDAFAAAVGRGALHRPNLAGAVKAGLVFGCIEAITPVIGWAWSLQASSNAWIIGSPSASSPLLAAR